MIMYNVTLQVPNDMTHEHLGNEPLLFMSQVTISWDSYQQPLCLSVTVNNMHLIIEFENYKFICLSI